MTNVEEKIEAVTSRFAGGHLFADRWNSFVLAREFVVLKLIFQSFGRV